MTTLIHPLSPDGALKTERPLLPADLGVLLVDDEEAVLTLGKRMLEKAGYRPLVAANGAEALCIARTMERLDVLVTDLIMPVMTGDELAHQLRERSPDLKVLYASGYRDQLFESNKLLREGEGFLDKPFSIAGMRQTIALLFYGQLAAPATA